MNQLKTLRYFKGSRSRKATALGALACLGFLCYYWLSPLPVVIRNPHDPSQPPFVNLDGSPHDAGQPTFANIDSITLSTADSSHNKLEIQMDKPFKMVPGDRLMILVSWRTDAYFSCDISVPIGFSMPTKPVVSSGMAGIGQHAGFGESNPIAIRRASFRGDTVTVDIDKKYFGSNPFFWRQRFYQAFTWFSAKGQTTTLSDIWPVSEIDNFDTNLQSFDPGPPEFYDRAEKPTYLPPGVKR